MSSLCASLDVPAMRVLLGRPLAIHVELRDSLLHSSEQNGAGCENDELVVGHMQSAAGGVRLFVDNQGGRELHLPVFQHSQGFVDIRSRISDLVVPRRNFECLAYNVS
jgi:hypothetical protein